MTVDAMVSFLLFFSVFAFFAVFHAPTCDWEQMKAVNPLAVVS